MSTKAGNNVRKQFLDWNILATFFCCCQAYFIFLRHNNLMLSYRDTIRYLLDNHLVDVTSIILSEGVPLMKNTHNANRTHSLHFGDDGSLHSNYVQNR